MTIIRVFEICGWYQLSYILSSDPVIGHDFINSPIFANK